MNVCIVKKNRIFVERIFPSECFFGIATKLLQPLEQSFAMSFASDGCNFMLIKTCPHAFHLGFIVERVTINGFVVHLCSRRECFLALNALFTLGFIHVECCHLVFGLNRD